MASPSGIGGGGRSFKQATDFYTEEEYLNYVIFEGAPASEVPRHMQPRLMEMLDEMQRQDPVSTVADGGAGGSQALSPPATAATAAAAVAAGEPGPERAVRPRPRPQGLPRVLSNLSRLSLGSLPETDHMETLPFHLVDAKERESEAYREFLARQQENMDARRRHITLRHLVQASPAAAASRPPSLRHQAWDGPVPVAPPATSARHHHSATAAAAPPLPAAAPRQHQHGQSTVQRQTVANCTADYEEASRRWQAHLEGAVSAKMDMNRALLGLAAAAMEAGSEGGDGASIVVGEDAEGEDDHVGGEVEASQAGASAAKGKQPWHWGQRKRHRKKHRDSQPPPQQPPQQPTESASRLRGN